MLLQRWIQYLFKCLIMAEYMSLYTSAIHRRSLTDTYNDFKQVYDGQDRLNLLYKYPADIEIIGDLHRHNTDFGFKQLLNASSNIGCPCCKSQYKNYQKDLSVWSVEMTPSSEGMKKGVFGEQAYQMGSEVVAYFTQLKIIIGLLLIRFAIFDLFFFIKALYFSADQYSRTELTKDGHLVDEDYILDQYLNLPAKILVAYYKYDIVAWQLFAVVISMIVLLAYSQKLQLKVFESIESGIAYESRYAIMVENIPLIPIVPGYEQTRFQNMGYEKRIKLYFKRYIRDNLLSKLRIHLENPEHTHDGLSKMQRELLQTFNASGQNNYTKLQEQIVQDVIVCYQNSCLSRLQKQKEELMWRYLNTGVQSKAEWEQDKLLTVNSIQKLNKHHLKMVNYFNNANSLSQKMPYFLGFAIVVFNFQAYRDFMIKESVEQSNNLRMNDTNRLVVRAGEKPSVVQWRNFPVRKQEQIKTRFYTNSILLIILMVTLVILSYLEMYKIIPMIEQWLHFPKRYQHKIKILIISGITSLINQLLSSIIQILAESERRLSKSGTALSLLTKNVVTQFFNSAMIYYLITFVTPASFLFEMKDLKQKIESLIIIPGVVRIIVNFLNAKYIFKKFQFEFYSSNNFQIEFNKLYERPEFDIVNRYTYYIVQLLTVSFYATLTPLIIPALILILPVLYYVDKLILFKKSSQPGRVSFRVTDWVHFLCQCSLLTFIVGWILFCPSELWTDFVRVVSYICLVIVIGYLGYRFKMVNNFERYYLGMKKSRKAHRECAQVMREKYRDYDPWKCYWKETKKMQSSVQFPLIRSTTEQTIN